MTLRDRRAHLMRAGPNTGVPRASRISSLSSFNISSIDLSINISVSIEADAWLIAQPSPSNFTSETLSSAIIISMRILSPQTGL